MNTMIKRKFFLIISGCLIAANALADANNCNKFERQTGYVEKVAVGVDDSNSNYISFSMEINNRKTGYISVKPTLNDNSGKALLSLLLEAARNQVLFTIDRCYSNQLAGGHITVD